MQKNTIQLMKMFLLIYYNILLLTEEPEEASSCSILNDLVKFQLIIRIQD